MTLSRTVDLRTLKIGAVLNTASGSCSDACADEMQSLFKECGLSLTHIWCSASDDLPLAFKEVQEKNLDVLVVLGGDGTIRSAAELCTQEGPLLIPLPGGTMNVLPKALYGTMSWQEILRAVLTIPSIQSVSGGTVAGHRFFITAICGAPALWTHAREALRAGNLEEVIAHGKVALGHMFADKVHYAFNEMHEGDAEALAVSCPLVSRALENDRQVFEAAVIDVKDAGDVMALATAAAFGEWRDAKQVAIVRTKRVTISSEGNIPIILDGETIDAGNEVTIEFLPDAFKTLVPTDEVLS